VPQGYGFLAFLGEISQLVSILSPDFLNSSGMRGKRTLPFVNAWLLVLVW
jgi:hypothetical protein